MNRISILPPILANQIAAGEVVERPASVVKELLENSLDAGASQLDIHLIAGGRQLIRIQDNGQGIHPEDLPLALARHATSKIQHSADLAQIQTLGFRGEALASIASIARVKITSQHADFDALCASVQGRDLGVTLYPAAHPRGTTVEVADLFFNTPARRKFLKSDRTEFLHIEEMIKRMALARPEVGFNLYHDEKLIKRFVAVPHDPDLRIEQVLTKSFMEGAVPIDSTISAFKLQGWLADLEFARSSTDMQFCYVNGRMVRDKLLNHAVRLAFEGKLYPGRFPAYILHLTCDPSAVDVNVHPTKHEVRFREARTVHDFVLSSLQKVMNPITMAPRPVVGANQPRTRGICPEIPIMSTQAPTRTVLTLLDNRVVILQQENILRAINWVKTLNNYISTQWSEFLSSTQKPFAPLLLPINIIHERVDSFIQKLSSLGIHSQLIGPNHLIIRELPRFLQGLPDQSLTPETLQLPSEQLQRVLSQAWIEAQSLNHRDIERLLDSIEALSPDLISSKDYVPDMLL